MARLHLTGGRYTMTGEAGTTSFAPMEYMIVLTLSLHARVSLPLLSEVLWPDPDNMPDTWKDQLRVLVGRVRKKLRPHGLIISIVYGRGYSIEEVTKT